MRILLLIVVLSTTCQMYAQNLLVKYRSCNPCGTNLNDDFDYGEVEGITFPTESVISDYGIRETNIKDASVFHQAIDYTVRGKEDAKFALQAVSGGSVTSITRVDLNNYKIIKVGGYGYGHIFTNSRENLQRYGKFILAKLDNYDEWAIIDLEFCRCFAESPGELVTIDDLDLKFCNTKRFRTINVVEAGWDIAPLGISGTKNSHLHLERYVVGSGRKADPNQFVNHDQTDFEVIIKSESSDENEIKLTYPGTKPTPFRVRAKMIGAEKIHTDGYKNKTMSADNVAILIERSSSSGYEEIVGPNFNSRISIGARDDSPITPWNAPEFDNRHKNKKFGSWTRSGIRPFAHNDVASPSNLRNEPYDDYYFTDFYTRIDKLDRKKITDIPLNAKYNDGKYKIKPTVTNVRDELFTIPGIDITLDNFLPFITRFQFKVGNTSPNAVFYDLDREQKEGEDNVKDDGIIANKRDYNPVNPGNRYFIELHSSEPLSNLTFRIKKNGAFLNNFNYPLTPDVTKTKWTSSVDITLFLNAADTVDFIVTGKDMSNNGIINIAEITKQEIIKPDDKKETLYNEPGTSIIIPTRKNNLIT